MSNEPKTLDCEELDSHALLDAMASNGEYTWQTDYYHHDNEITAGDFVEYHLPDDFEVTLDDGTYIEVSNGEISKGVHISGNGDSYDHRAEFVSI